MRTRKQAVCLSLKSTVSNSCRSISSHHSQTVHSASRSHSISVFTRTLTRSYLCQQQQCTIKSLFRSLFYGETMEALSNITGKEGILQLLSLAMSHRTKMETQLQFRHTASMFINSTHQGRRFSRSILQAMVSASVIFRFRFNG